MKSLKISDKTHRELKSYCAKNNIKMMEFVDNIIGTYLIELRSNSIIKIKMPKYDLTKQQKQQLIYQIKSHLNELNKFDITFDYEEYDGKYPDIEIIKDLLPLDFKIFIFYFKKHTKSGINKILYAFHELKKTENIYLVPLLSEEKEGLVCLNQPDINIDEYYKKIDEILQKYKLEYPDAEEITYDERDYIKKHNLTVFTKSYFVDIYGNKLDTHEANAKRVEEIIIKVNDQTSRGMYLSPLDDIYDIIDKIKELHKELL